MWKSKPFAVKRPFFIPPDAPCQKLCLSREGCASCPLDAVPPGASLQEYDHLVITVENGFQGCAENDGSCAPRCLQEGVRGLRPGGFIYLYATSSQQAVRVRPFIEGDNAFRTALVAGGNLDEYFPLHNPRAMSFYYSQVNRKAWPVRLLLGMSLRAGIVDRLHAFLVPVQVWVWDKSG